MDNKPTDKWEWVSVEDENPPIDTDDNWNQQTGQSKDVFTWSDFGLRQGRYFHKSGHWQVTGVTSSNGVNVTHWMPLPSPPNK